MIHYNWSSCNSKLDPECLSQSYVLQTGGAAAECSSLSSDSVRLSELFRLGHLIPLMFFFLYPLPLIEELLVLTCTVPDSEDITHTHASVHRLTCILMSTSSWSSANTCETTRIFQSAPFFNENSYRRTLLCFDFTQQIKYNWVFYIHSFLESNMIISCINTWMESTWSLFRSLRLDLFSLMLKWL